MKHLKKYESVNNDIIKKYVIWQGDDEWKKGWTVPIKSYLGILKILKYDKECDDYVYRTLYDVWDGQLEKLSPPNEKEYLGDIKYVIYTSNELQNCIDMIPILINSNKYNL